MKVSVITVVVNGEEFIEDCIKSVRNQSYDNLEYIVVDGRSTDRTLQIIQACSEDIDFFLSEPDEGMYHALNKGIGRATGDIIGVLHADDVFAHSRVISTIVDCFLNENCDAIYGNLDMLDREGTGNILRRWRSKQYRLSDLKLGWMPAHPTFYVKRSVLWAYQLYRPEFGISADYELMLRLLYRYQVKAVFLKHTLVCMRTGGMSNGSIGKLLRTLLGDFYVLREAGIHFPLATAVIKKLRKIIQYF